MWYKEEKTTQYVSLQILHIYKPEHALILITFTHMGRKEKYSKLVILNVIMFECKFQDFELGDTQKP